MVKPTLEGHQLGNFIIEDLIGEGGMGSVYRARQPAMQRDVALKVIHLDMPQVDSERFQERFTREAELIAGLEHIHIVPVFDYGLADHLAYLAMRLMTGGTLADLIQGQPLSLERAVEVTGQITQALTYAHAKGVIHSDLKPANIMLDDSGNVQLTDFGLAKMISGRQDASYDHISGTPAYMAPEQLRGEITDQRADVYSLGLIVYLMLTGTRPFDAPSSEIVTVIYQHLHLQPEPPRKFNPAVPPAVERVVMRALEKQPQDRQASAAEFMAELNAAMASVLSLSYAGSQRMVLILLALVLIVILFLIDNDLVG
jgi:serine/threonine-protein kinase